jgi:hypothetical protein
LNKLIYIFYIDDSFYLLYYIKEYLEIIIKDSDSMAQENFQMVRTWVQIYAIKNLHLCLINISLHWMFIDARVGLSQAMC